MPIECCSLVTCTDALRSSAYAAAAGARRNHVACAPQAPRLRGRFRRAVRAQPELCAPAVVAAAEAPRGRAGAACVRARQREARSAHSGRSVRLSDVGAAFESRLPSARHCGALRTKTAALLRRRAWIGRLRRSRPKLAVRRASRPRRCSRRSGWCVRTAPFGCTMSAAAQRGTVRVLLYRS